MNRRPKPGDLTASNPQAVHRLPRVTVPRHMLEDVPPSPLDVMREQIKRQQLEQQRAYRGRHAAPYNRTNDVWGNPDYEPRHALELPF